MATKLPGKRIIALNVMWKYLGLKSFPVTEDEYVAHLDAIAQSLRAIRQVSIVHQFIKKRRDKPRYDCFITFRRFCLYKCLDEILLS